MSYAEIKPQYYRMHQPDSPWHAGSSGWKSTPWPSWGVNPNLVGPPRLGVEGLGLGAYYKPEYERAINGLGAYYKPEYERAISGLGMFPQVSTYQPVEGLGQCSCAVRGVGADTTPGGGTMAAWAAVAALVGVSFWITGKEVGKVLKGKA